MDTDKKEIILRLLKILEEDEDDEEEEQREKLDLYTVRAPKGFYDPGWERLRRLVWPHG